MTESVRDNSPSLIGGGSQNHTKARAKKLSHKQILVKILIPQAWRYIDQWIRDSSPQQRLGLRMISAIVQHKGEKRFKKRSTEATLPTQQTQAGNLSTYTPGQTFRSPRQWELACSEFKKNMNKTSYGRYFGGDLEKKQRESELHLIQGKKFYQTKISQVLTSSVVQSVEKWLSIQKEDDYKNMVLGMIRSYFTRVKNYQFTRSTCRDGFTPPKKQMMAKAPRYDKLRTAIQFNQKMENYNKSKTKNLSNLGIYQSSDTRSAYRGMRSMSSARKTNRSCSGSASSIIGSPAQLKAQFLKGNGKITDSLADLPGKSFPSLYQDSFKAHMVQNKVMRRTDQDFFSRSFSGPHVSPDPPTIYHDRAKISRFTANLSEYTTSKFPSPASYM